MVSDEFMTFMKAVYLEVDKTKVMQYVTKKGQEWVAQNTGACGTHTIETEVGLQFYRIETFFLHEKNIQSSILDYCLCNLIILWNDELTEIIKKNFDDCFKGKRLINNTIYEKLSTDISIKDLISNPSEFWLNSFVKDFNFETYKERIRIIEKVTGIAMPEDIKGHLNKAVEIRNIIQHHSSIINEDILRKLGRDNIEIYNNDGTRRQYKKGDKIELTLAEIMSTRNAILQAGMYFIEEHPLDHWRLDKFTDSMI